MFSQANKTVPRYNGYLLAYFRMRISTKVSSAVQDGQGNISD